uniref:Pseudouridylate synthase PUS7L n=1 Tax=Sphenodon punctatus TaxID=8508 RepID=A0A8D0L6K8_SPHPU
MYVAVVLDSFLDCSDQQNVVIMVRFREKNCSRKRTADCQQKQELYTAFILQKENLETLEAIGFLSSELGVLPSDFSYTGIKDKKAITYQAMVVKKVTPERLKEVGSTIERKGMKVSNIHSVHQHLRLGQLKGNHFDIIVRDLKHQGNDTSANLKERISEAIENVKKNGFINYYGPQRFGQGQNVHTDQIGLALLNEEMVHVVTTAEESANKYIIQEVVLPMAGHNVKYPNNKVGQQYHKMLTSDGLQMCRFRVPALQLNIPGCYRHILKHPHNLSYHFSDDSVKEIGTGDNHLDESKDSLCLSFGLDPSCYATVCLREIMKCDL